MRARPGVSSPLALAASLEIALLLGATSVFAQDSSRLPLPPAPPSDVGPAAPGEPGSGKAADTTRPRFWAEGESRLFFATSIDLGFLYLRPRAIIGYGKPFWTWFGLEANPQVSQRFLGGYAGLRAELPLVDLRVGGRYVFSFQQAQLRPRAEYGRLELESRELPRSTYVALEAELSSAVPAGPGSVLLLGTVNRLSGFPKDTFVFDQVLRIVVAPPWVYRGRIGYAVRVGPTGKVGVGLVAEALHVPERGTTTIRAGLIATATLSNHLEIIGSFVPPLLGPDTLGTVQGDFAQLGIRYRWATGGSNEPMVVPVDF
jgi:hypothetical protein